MSHRRRSQRGEPHSLSHQRRRARQWGWIMAAGLGLVVWHEVPYINWRMAVAPVETVHLVLRHDVKGDGAYHATRSGGRQHRGIDLAAPLGSPVRAIRSGDVVGVGMHRGLGRFVELKHAGGLRSLYGHLSETAVTAGERVAQGQPIGTVGKTGNARHPLIEPHVHLEVVRWGEWIDPTNLGLAAASDWERQPDGRGGE